RAAYFRFTFPDTDQANVLIDAFDRGSYVKVIPEENKIIGYTTRNSGGVPDNFKNYFVLVFDRPFDGFSSFADSVLVSGRAEAQADHVGTIVTFNIANRGEQVLARVASSFISHEQAERNLQELGGRSVEQVVQDGEGRWNEELSKVTVEGGTVAQMQTFYSSLYRTILFPRMFYEYDEQGNPYHYSPYNGQVLPGYMFTDTGFWDTFRALFPFLNLVYPEVNAKIQEGLANTYKEGG